MNFVVATESALRPRAYFGPRPSTQPSDYTTPRLSRYCHAYIYAHMVLTSQVLLYRLWISIYSWMAAQWFQTCTLMCFMVATESALRPRAYFSLRAHAHYLEREVRTFSSVW